MRVGQTNLLMIECPKYDWLATFCHKRLCYRRATAGTFVLDLLYIYITPSDNIDFFARMWSMRTLQSICHEGLCIGQATRAEKPICPRRPCSTGCNSLYGGVSVYTIYYWTYSDLQKHESRCLLSDCFLCISPEPLELKKVIFIDLNPCLKSFQMKKEFFKSGYKISWYLQKRCFDRKK